MVMVSFRRVCGTATSEFCIKVKGYLVNSTQTRLGVVNCDVCFAANAILLLWLLLCDSNLSTDIFIKISHLYNMLHYKLEPIPFIIHYTQQTADQVLLDKPVQIFTISSC